MNVLVEQEVVEQFDTLLLRQPPVLVPLDGEDRADLRHHLVVGVLGPLHARVGHLHVDGQFRPHVHDPLVEGHGIGLHQLLPVEVGVDPPVRRPVQAEGVVPLGERRVLAKEVLDPGKRKRPVK